MFGKVFWNFFLSAGIGVKIHQILPYDIVVGFILALYLDATLQGFYNPEFPFEYLITANGFTFGFMLDYFATWLHQYNKPKPEVMGPLERFQRAYRDQTYRREHLMVRWESRFYESYIAIIGCAEGFTVVLEYQRPEDLEVVQEFIRDKRMAGWIVLDMTDKDLGGSYKRYRFTAPVLETQTERKDEPVKV
jgi:hypothetical protein